MDIKAALYYYLYTVDSGAHGAPLSALIDSRLYPEEAPQSPTLPYVVHEWREDDVIGTLVAPSPLAQQVATFMVFGRTSDERDAVVEALRNCLDGRSDIQIPQGAGTVFVRSIRRQGKTPSFEPPEDGTEDKGSFVYAVDYLVTFGQPAATLP